MKQSNRDDGWLTGRLYFNREDKRVIIKRPRSGFGYTVNLGNKWTWIFNITQTSHIKNKLKHLKIKHKLAFI